MSQDRRFPSTHRYNASESYAQSVDFDDRVSKVPQQQKALLMNTATRDKQAKARSRLRLSTTAADIISPGRSEVRSALEDRNEFVCNNQNSEKSSVTVQEQSSKARLLRGISKGGDIAKIHAIPHPNNDAIKQLTEKEVTKELTSDMQLKKSSFSKQPDLTRLQQLIRSPAEPASDHQNHQSAKSPLGISHHDDHVGAKEYLKFSDEDPSIVDDFDRLKDYDEIDFYEHSTGLLNIGLEYDDVAASLVKKPYKRAPMAGQEEDAKLDPSSRNVRSSGALGNVSSLCAESIFSTKWQQDHSSAIYCTCSLS